MHKKLVIIRHAKSDWKDLSVIFDYDRSLNHRGKRDAPEMARRLAAKGYVPDLIVTSGAKRTVFTAELMLEAVPQPDPVPMLTKKKLFDCDVYDMELEMRTFPNDKQTIFLIGHNPVLTKFAEKYVPQKIKRMPTCGVLAFEVRTDFWHKINPVNARFQFFDFPKNTAS